MTLIAIGENVTVGSLATRWRPAPVGIVEALDLPGLPRGVKIRFAELVNDVDHCYASYDEVRSETR